MHAQPPAMPGHAVAEKAFGIETGGVGARHLLLP
jgi:hypothetical protein